MRPDRPTAIAAALVFVIAACTGAATTTTVTPPPTSTAAAAAPTTTVVAATTTLAPTTTTTSAVAAADCAGRYVGSYEGKRSGVATAALLPAGVLRLRFQGPRESGRLSVGEDGQIAGSIAQFEISASLDTEECVISGEWSDGGVVAGSFELAKSSDPVRGFQELDVVELDEIQSPDIEVRSDGTLLAYALLGVLFTPNSSEVRPYAHEVIETVAGSIRRRFTPEATILVRGHTDSVGDADYNLDLSQRRAEAVADLLGAELDGFEIVADGLGETEPSRDNSTHIGRMANRRVEIFVDPGE